jgi:hypothetical protein
MDPIAETQRGVKRSAEKSELPQRPEQEPTTMKDAGASDAATLQPEPAQPAEQVQGFEVPVSCGSQSVSMKCAS